MKVFRPLAAPSGTTAVVGLDAPPQATNSMNAASRLSAFPTLTSKFIIVPLKLMRPLPIGHEIDNGCNAPTAKNRYQPMIWMGAKGQNDFSRDKQQN